MQHDRVQLFTSIGLSEKFVKGFVKNEQKSLDLEAVVLEAGAGKGCDASTGALLLRIAEKLKKNSLSLEHRPKLLKMIMKQYVKRCYLV